MKIAVFGAGSLVGQELTVMALHQGHTVFAVVRGSEANALRSFAERNVNVLQPLPSALSVEQLRRERKLSSPAAPGSPVSAATAHALGTSAPSGTTMSTAAEAEATLARRLQIVTSDVPWSQDALQVIHEADVIISTVVPKLATERGHAMGLDRIIATMHDVRRSNRSRGLRQRLIAMVGEGVLQATKNKLMMQLPGFSPKFHQAAVEHLAGWIALVRSNLDWTLVCAPPVVAKVVSASGVPMSAPASRSGSSLDIRSIANKQQHHAMTVNRSLSKLSINTQDSGCDCSMATVTAGATIANRGDSDLAQQNLRTGIMSPQKVVFDNDTLSTPSHSRSSSALSTVSAGVYSIDSVSSSSVYGQLSKATNQGRSKSLSDSGTNGLQSQNQPYAVAVDVLPNWTPHEAGMTICRVNDIAEFILDVSTSYPAVYSQMRVGIASNVRPGS